MKASPPPADEDLTGEPDYRFTLANERTLLAWTRTSLALIAGGVALETFATTLQPPWLPRVIGLFAIVIGGSISVIGYIHWQRIQLAMRRGDPLPMQIAAPFLTFGIVLVALALAIGILL